MVMMKLILQVIRNIHLESTPFFQVKADYSGSESRVQAGIYRSLQLKVANIDLSPNQMIELTIK
ncbi:hypothetical protein GCM10010912_57610 [Paenibacillus albidus]|uniref:Uncharacterized protein n=1 Tax=Paenibacillus albidus TaxID=2041023 RepID=A0A917D0B2_9BACL|nr:hypothetical protein GCM10010912_57610 [Paenibacillus albidus]